MLIEAYMSGGDKLDPVIIGNGQILMALVGNILLPYHSSRHG